MVMKWVRENVYASAILAIIRVYLGWKWLDAGWHKISGSGFDASGFLKKAVGTPLADNTTKEVLYPTFTKFVENFALPNVKLINFLIPWGEFLIGLGLILGVLTTAAAFFGLMLNFMFMFAGTVSTNPWLMLFGFIILFAGANAGRFGGDRFVLPYVRKWLKLDRIGAGSTLKG